MLINVVFGCWILQRLCWVVVLVLLQVEHRPAHDARGRLGGESQAGALYTRNPVNCDLMSCTTPACFSTFFQYTMVPTQ